MPSEYDNIDLIGTTHEYFKDIADQKMKKYYHKQEVRSVKELLEKLKLKNYDSMIDLGCSIGTWYNDFKKMKFQKIIGIDISEERGKIAKERGYNQIHICNAHDLPFDDKSQTCVISSDVLIHVMEDEDVVKILKEVYRVLQDKGIFIFNFANSEGLTKKDIKMKYCKFRNNETFQKMIEQTDFKIKHVIPSYYAIPQIGAHPKIVTLSAKIIFPIIDEVFKILNITKFAKVIYFALQK